MYYLILIEFYLLVPFCTTLLSGKLNLERRVVFIFVLYNNQLINVVL